MRFELTTLDVIGTDCTGSCKSNYHTFTSMMAPRNVYAMYYSTLQSEAYCDRCINFLCDIDITFVLFDYFLSFAFG